MKFYQGNTYLKSFQNVNQRAEIRKRNECYFKGLQ